MRQIEGLKELIISEGIDLHNNGRLLNEITIDLEGSVGESNRKINKIISKHIEGGEVEFDSLSSETQSLIMELVKSDDAEIMHILGIW